MNTLVYEEIPNSLFIPVIRKRDIVKARPLSRVEKQERESGSPDIILLSPIGEQRFITRKEMVDKYTYLDGKKINIRGWSSNRTYMVGCMDSTRLFAMLVPLNCTISLKGREANKNTKQGDYIICLSDIDGGINRESANLISNKMFKKMFSVPENNAITRNIGKGNRMFNLENTKRKKIYNREVKNTDDSILNKDEFYMMANEIQKQPSSILTNNILSNKEEVKRDKEEVKSNNSSQQYIAIGRLMQNGALTGFIVQNSNGATRNVTKQEMMRLCQRKMISNIVLSKKENSNAYYLRGNGIRIDMLQSYDI